VDSPLFVKEKYMKLEIFGLPIFSILNVASKNIKGYKLTLLGLFHLSVTFGDHKGDHIHLSVGIYKCELFGGITLWS
tara:strand:- start:277 stop:507 length:231 start_codon:yes stop_codon:yes gene_type:complete